MFPTRKPVSEFTQRAFEGHVKELEDLTEFSKTDLYGILSGERADHLRYGRELHRGLCVCHPETAKEYRDLLAADADVVTPRAMAHTEAPDDLAVKRLCDEMTTALLGDEETKASAMRKLHALLGARLRTVYPTRTHLANAG